MNTKFFALNASFAVVAVTTSSDFNADIIVKQDVLQHLSATQLVQIAKSMNPELKVNTKQNREVIVAAINKELETFPVTVIAKTSSSTGSTKNVCWAAFDLIDMNDKPLAREAIDKLVQDHGFSKAVVQSYASDYRKAKRA